MLRGALEGGETTRSLLQPLLLLLIYERPGHGYDLIDRLSRLGVTGVEPGHVYRVLRNLERERCVVSGWVTSGPGPARRRYELTPRGLTELNACMSQLTQLGQVVGSCLDRWADASGPGGDRRARAVREGGPAGGV